MDCTDYPCGKIDALEGCDVTLGGGVVATWGLNASNEDCGFPDGRRYLQTSDAMLEDKFACAATLGTGGYGQEKPAGAGVAAVSDELGMAGACNEGFLRDDAILVVTLISNASKTGDNNNGDPVAWHDALVAAKNGNEDAIVMIGLLSEGNGCFEPTDNYEAWVESFGDHGLVSSICDVDYGPVFAEGVGIIDQACDDFVPEG
jgi:hypothetical protein